MSGLFASRGSSGEPWFRLGRLEVGTTMFVVLAIAASWIAWVAAPGLPGALAFSMSAVADGQLWRLVTWPFANGLTLWTVLNLFFFWYFGTELEQMIGRNRMAWLLVGVWGTAPARCWPASGWCSSRSCCCGSPSTRTGASSSASRRG